MSFITRYPLRVLAIPLGREENRAIVGVMQLLLARIVLCACAASLMSAHPAPDGERQSYRYGEAEYTSGRIHSRGKGDWLYGRIDIRARLPGGQGTWPALWMLPTDAFKYATTCAADPEEWQGDDDCDAWPNSGEIDIMEHVGYDMHRLHGTVHNKAYYAGNGQQRKGSVEVRDLEQVFHVYSLEWTPELLRIYYDGVPYFTYVNDGQGWESWPYDHPYHLIMNLAIGGHWGGAGGPIDDAIFPVRLEVDYVRVFEPVSPR